MRHLFLNTPASLGAAIRESRAELGWSQTDLAERAGVPDSLVAQAEQGERRSELAGVLKILDALEIHALALPEPPAPPPLTEADLDHVIRDHG